MLKYALFPILWLTGFYQQQNNAKEIVKISDERQRGNTMRGEMVFKIVRPEYTREIDMNMWMKGNDYSLIQILSPARDKGTTYLKRKKEVWDWIPTLERTIKLPPSMMSQSWMGTDFTNDDLVKEVSIVDDYDQTLMGEENFEGRMCYKIQLIPKPTAAVVWSKVVMWIDKKDYLQLKTESYGDDGQVANTLIGSDVRMMGGRLLPCTLEIAPSDKPGHKTIVTYKSRQFDQPINDDFFSTREHEKPPHVNYDTKTGMAQFVA